MKFVCEGPNAHNLGKSDLMKSVVSFDYSVLFLLPKEQAASCHGCLFNTFSARSCVARELRRLHIEEFMDLVDDLRYTHIDDDSRGLTVGDMVTFLRGCPEICRKEKTLTMFRLSCVCIGHFPPVLFSLKIGSSLAPPSDPELSKVIKSLQSYLLSCGVENNIFTDPSSINECVELLEGFAGTALHSSYDVWTFVSFCGKDCILNNSVSSYKETRSAECVDGDNLSFSAPETLCLQIPIARQPPKVDLAKVQSLLH